jgi:acetyl-CoA C-acetyltransferase
MQPVYIIDARRTAIGKYGGGLRNLRPDDLLAFIIKELLKRNEKIDVHQIEEVIAGAANQSGEDNRNVARMAVLLAGLPTTVAAVTVNRLCASGLQSIMDAARAINNGDGELYIAAGVESMTRAPFVQAKAAEAWSRNPEIFDTTMGWRFINERLSALYHPFTMGETAENIARQWKISREEQDLFALQSQDKYAAAKAANKFLEEIVPVPIQTKNESVVFDTDEHPRISSLEKLAQLKPVFIPGGTVTAGNSSGINDGAAAMLLASLGFIKENNIKPIAKIISMAVVGVDPSIMGIGPVPAVKKALQRANLSIDKIDLWELNEAFASQSIACIRDLGLDAGKINVNGGAIALGHPLGCSGTRISTTLLHEMQKQNAQYGVATMCVGLGQGAAIIYEKV